MTPEMQSTLSLSHTPRCLVTSDWALGPLVVTSKLGQLFSSHHPSWSQCGVLVATLDLHLHT